MLITSPTPPVLNLLLTSDLPLSWNDEVLRRMKALGAAPRIAFISPFTDVDRVRFRAARDLFSSRGFEHVEYVDIDPRWMTRSSRGSTVARWAAR